MIRLIHRSDATPNKAAREADKVAARSQRYLDATIADDEDLDPLDTQGDAVRALEARVHATPDDRQLRRTLSTAYLRAGRLAEAKEQLRQVEALLGRRGARGVGCQRTEDRHGAACGTA